MTVNVIAVTFDEQSKAYQALSTLKGLDREGRIELKSAAVVERGAAGQLQIPEDTDNASGEGFRAGGLIGMLVGVLGGPIGMLLGLGTGGLVGGIVRRGSGRHARRDAGGGRPPRTAGGKRTPGRGRRIHRRGCRRCHGRTGRGRAAPIR